MILLFLFIRKVKNSRDKLMIASIRGIVYFLLIFSLTIPTLHLPVESKQIVFLLDQSESVADQTNKMLDIIEESIKVKNTKDEFAIVSFANNTLIEFPFQTSATLNALQENTEKGNTNLENALITSASLFEHGTGRVVLFSDGNETIGSSRDILTLLSEQGMEVDIVPLSSEEKDDMALTSLTVSETMFEGELATVTVRIHSNRDKQANLRLSLNDQDIIVQELAVKRGDNIFTFTHPVEEHGLFVYRADIASQNDFYIENNSLYAVSNVVGTPKILLVESEPSSLQRILLNAGLGVDSVLPEQLPTTLSHFLQYQNIIFNNISGTHVTEQQMELIEQSVRDFGNGFIMLGGGDSFGLGGYFKTPIEKILPVEMEIKGKEELPSLGLVIVLDRSGSMQGQKLAMAKEAAARSIELLREEDTLGFIAFDDRPWVIVETGPIEDKQETADKIRSITAGGGTEIYTSLQMAFDELNDLKLQRKHIILLTDGDSATSGDYYSLIEEGKEHNVTLSTVAIGLDANSGLLESLAEEGGGRFYNVTDESVIPSILTRETVMITRTYIEDDPFYPTVYAIDGWDSLFTSGVPQMNAYIATTPKATAKFPLISEKEDPILAQWQYGLGTTIAFTSDITGRWSGDFAAWQNWPQFLSFMVSRTLPKYGSQLMDLEVVNRGSKTYLNLRGSQSQLYQLDTAIVSETGEKIESNIKMTAPGNYEVEIPNEPGLYFLNASQRMENGEINNFQSGFTIPYSQEYIITGTNLDLLNTIAESTNGKIIDSSEEIFRNLEHQPYNRTSLSQWTLILAFILLFIEFVLRRLGVAYCFGVIKGFFTRKKQGRKTIERKTTDQLLQRKKTTRKKPSKSVQNPVPANQNKASEQNDPKLNKNTVKQKKTKEVIVEEQEQTEENLNRQEQMNRLLEARKRKR